VLSSESLVWPLAAGAACPEALIQINATAGNATFQIVRMCTLLTS
jgi:hypothetical protein